MASMKQSSVFVVMFFLVTTFTRMNVGSSAVADAAFVVGPSTHHHDTRQPANRQRQSLPQPASFGNVGVAERSYCLFKSSSSSSDSLGLTEELQKITDAFEAIGDDKLRYKQLLYMATNGLEPMPEALKVEENRVLGCLSTVYVHATIAEDSGNVDSPRINFAGDSDGLLTKGLTALLVRGLSGNTADAIERVDPLFIQKAGISQSLTPGRNNGFLNMIALMKKKAREIGDGAGNGNVAATVVDNNDNNNAEEQQSSGSGDRPIYNAILEKLQALQPTTVELNDFSEQENGETHFSLTIVSAAFDGLKITKRQQLIYMFLGDIMPKIETLQIRANTPAEVEEQ